MKSIIAAAITCAILFGVSFAASKYYIQAEVSDETTEVEPLEESVDQSSTLPPNEGDIQKVPALPVSHRPEKSVSIEAVLQMSDSIKKLQEKLILRERKVEKEEQRVQLLFVDVETEQDRLKALSDGIDTKVESLAKMLTELRTLSDSIDEKKKELEKLEKEAGVDEESRQTEMNDKVNGVKSWFANLEAQQASEYLKEFANNGKLDFAASLLNKMPDRQKSKILAELNDPGLVDQLISALKIKPKTE